MIDESWPTIGRLPSLMIGSRTTSPLWVAVPVFEWHSDWCPVSGIRDLIFCQHANHCLQLMKSHSQPHRQFTPSYLLGIIERDLKRKKLESFEILRSFLWCAYQRAMYLGQVLQMDHKRSKRDNCSLVDTFLILCTLDGQNKHVKNTIFNKSINVLDFKWFKFGSENTFLKLSIRPLTKSHIFIKLRCFIAAPVCLCRHSLFRCH